MKPPPPAEAVESERDFVDFINALNAQWISASKRLSPRVLTDLDQRASRDVADWFESLPLDAPALFPVSWAGEQASAGWFDIGREFTELWHHQQQIRMAVGGLTCRSDPRYLGAVIDVAVRGLPHAFRDVSAGPGQTVVIDISGPRRRPVDAGARDRAVDAGAESRPWATARIRLDVDAAWKLLFNALSGRCAHRPRRRTAAPCHSSSARPIGDRVDEDDRDRSGWRSAQRHDILDLDEGTTHEQMGRRGQSSYGRTRQAHDDRRRPGSRTLTRRRTCQTRKTIATERQLLIDSMSLVLDQDDAEAASSPGVAEFDAGSCMDWRSLALSTRRKSRSIACSAAGS